MKPRCVLSRGLWLLLILVVVTVGCAENEGPAPTDTAGRPAGDTRSSSSVTSEDASALQAMQNIEEQVSKLRGLETQEPVSKAFLNTGELRERILAEVTEDYSEQEARDDVLLYAAFELADMDLDLYNLLIDLQTEQVLGFYDADEKEMFVVKGDQAPGALERMTYAHEYTHVLQDQHFDLQALGFSDEGGDKDEDSEKDFAVRSLVEGDASLLMQQYALQHLKFDDLQEIVSQSADSDTSVFDSAPEIVRESLMFPYEAGLMFVAALYGEGGWSAVDAAYANPPVSTEQIIHPERYPDDVPQIVSLPPLTDTLGAGWRLVDEDVLGEFGVQQYLQVRTAPSGAEVAAEGWGGDRYAVYWRDDESAYVLVERSSWDAPADADEFFDTYVQFAEDRFGGEPTRREGNDRLWWFGDDTLFLARNDEDEILIIIAPDEAMLDEVHGLFPRF